MTVAERKYISEFAVNLCSARWQLILPHQLNAGSKITDPVSLEISENCHIYLICKRPSSVFDPNNFSFDGKVVRGNIVYKIGGVETYLPFELPFCLPAGAVSLELAPYPCREFECKNAKGEVLTYFPAMALSINGVISNASLQKLEVLYVGQAYAEGKRTAIDRLKSHSTLQRVLSDTHYSFPDDEILILTFEYSPYRVISWVDGTEKKAISGEKDITRFESIMDNPLSKAQQISLAEAGLIRYFQPHYNVVYKDSFPSSDQALLDSCYHLDFSALIVEIDTEDLDIYLCSLNILPNQHHIAQFNLVDTSVRRGFFTFIGKDGKAVEMPNVISRSK
ncbi:hypothetical protein [Gluconobacter oxydans]|uniref:hypothetical protein n=1 Tax=Gluconobacter oxydans TaxID=442 RepID=UPI000AC84A81|nr:hypothetical protein [Gluconobacter oxydans]